MAAAATCSLAPAGHSSAQHSLELHLPQSITLHCQTFGSMLLTPHCVVAGPLVGPGPPHTSLPEVVSQQLSAIDSAVSLHRSCVPRSRRKRHSGSRQSWPRRPSKTVPSHSGSALGPTTRSGPPPPLSPPSRTHIHTRYPPTQSCGASPGVLLLHSCAKLQPLRHELDRRSSCNKLGSN